MKRQFTVSTFIFNSLKEAEMKLADWREAGTLNDKSKVFEIKEIYQPIIKLVKIKLKHE